MLNSGDRVNDFQKAMQLIEKTDLSKEDKDFWFNQLSKLPQERVKIFIYFLENLPQKLAWLTSLQKRKVKAFETGDTATWDALLQEEQTELEKTEKEGDQNARN